MKLRKLAIGLIFCLAVSAMCFAADDPNVGTWKLNESKSKIPAGAPKNSTVTYTAEGDQYKGSVDGVDGKGSPIHSEWTGKFDGKDYAVTGDPNVDMRSIKETSPGHYSIANKKDGKTIVSGTIVVSKDGKTRTVTTRGTDPGGKKRTATYVYEKQ
jgi:hypothetical protein